ncbi:TetR family transcriptional regulator [Actinoplanes bogorensis]|uniref:TetR family transcriptional regulator n=1 Tax=Paractinoplanes bogorensis TaxID=1610840 RepID=A0ABS5YXQ1_9ACTN|nr:TetR family transcriptional regulator [Actinoplanes bogorensis]MBU2668217.1 TetR family transcriptional regulator [Actinoplanes bogorensis]
MAPTEARPQPRRRADAERSIARIVAAARSSLSRDPDATVDEIALAAGVGRMTVYGHFRTRPELVEAALAEALRVGEETLSAVDLTGDPREALARLLASSWSLVSESSALLAAAEKVLPEGRVRELHGSAADRVEALLGRGQADGVFRTDLPMSWLVNVIQHVLHGAAEEVRAGRLAEHEVARVVTRTVLSMLTDRPAH